MNELERRVQGLQFLDKLTVVCELGKVDFWEDRANPPNLSRDEFELIISRIDEARGLKWRQRKSRSGLRGMTGEEYCFYFHCTAEFGGVFDIERKHYFIKGYYFDRGSLLGAVIQSFREE